MSLFIVWIVYFVFRDLRFCVYAFIDWVFLILHPFTYTQPSKTADTTSMNVDSLGKCSFTHNSGEISSRVVTDSKSFSEYHGIVNPRLSTREEESKNHEYEPENDYFVQLPRFANRHEQLANQQSQAHSQPTVERLNSPIQPPYSPILDPPTFVPTQFAATPLPKPVPTTSLVGMDLMVSAQLDSILQLIHQIDSNHQSKIKSMNMRY